MESPHLRTAHPVGPSGSPAASRALDELDLVYAFLLARVGHRPDAEDLVQEVAMKALPRLRDDAALGQVRAYLFQTARTALADFWSLKLGRPTSALTDRTRPWETNAPDSSARPTVEAILGRLPEDHRRVLELRFLQGHSIREVAQTMARTPGAIKQLQLRALRAAAESRRPLHTPPARDPSPDADDEPARVTVSRPA